MQRSLNFDNLVLLSERIIHIKELGSSLLESTSMLDSELNYLLDQTKKRNHLNSECASSSVCSRKSSTLSESKVVCVVLGSNDDVSNENKHKSSNLDVKEIKNKKRRKSLIRGSLDHKLEIAIQHFVRSDYNKCEAKCTNALNSKTFKNANAESEKRCKILFRILLGCCFASNNQKENAIREFTIAAMESEDEVKLCIQGFIRMLKGSSQTMSEGDIYGVEEK